MEERGKPLFVLTVALALLFILSFFGWEKVSGGYLKSFDLLSDLKDSRSTDMPVTATDYLDPDLQALNGGEHFEYIDEDTNSESIKKSDSEEQDPYGEEDMAGENNADSEINYESPNHDINLSHTEISQSIYEEEQDDARIIDFSGSRNFDRLRSALQQSGNRLVRIGVLGDSYIEGDIFTQGLREGLQNRYGGKGIGYTPVFSEFPGFRRSVIHSCNGFELMDFRKKSQNPYCLLQGVAYKAEEEASATFSGTNKVQHADAWDQTRILIKSPQGGSLKIRSGNGKQQPWETYTLEASEQLQCIDVPGNTSKVSIASITPGTVIEGIYLDGNTGVAVDNMSIRGYSGIRHDELNKGLIEASRQFVDYDVIILEFGINALSAAQTNYSAYGEKMIEVVNSMKQLYPEAVIIIMGIGDRGEKRGGEIQSMTTIPAMIKTQKHVAAATGSIFWNTREAMGGEGSVVDWVDKKDINKDYIHLSFTGGKRLSDLFLEDLDTVLR